MNREQLELVNLEQYTVEPESLFQGLPKGKFQTIMIDPPWTYNLRVGDKTHRNQIDYSSLSLEQISQLPIVELADPAGCALWLWYTNNHVGEAVDLIRHWGFTQKTILTWVKTTKSGLEVRLGVGHWLRNCTEHCMLATIGKQRSFRGLGTLTNQSTVILEPRREHSRKPEGAYRRIEGLQPNARRLELFARSERPGWVVWGNEVDKFSA